MKTVNKVTEIRYVKYSHAPQAGSLLRPLIATAGNVRLGRASLEGHKQAVTGCLDAYTERIIGQDAG